MLDVLLAIIPLYILISLGLVASRIPGLKGADASLNTFVFWFALPAFLFDSVATAPSGAGLPPSMFIVTFVATLLFFCVVYLGAVLLGLKRLAGPLAAAAGYGNVAYLGFPVILSVFGQQAALPMALAAMTHNILFLVGYPVLASFRQGGEGNIGRALLKAVPYNPTIVSVLLGLVFYATGWSLPGLIMTPISMMAQAVIPVALFAVGLALPPAIKALMNGGSSILAVLVVSVLKSVALPLLTWGAAVLFIPDPTGVLTGTLVLMAAMPTGVNAFTMAQEFDGEGRLVAAVIAVSTVLTLVTASVFGVLVA
ncbi:MAG: AEC family transporter [Propionibacterium sp.]|nr:AEC family transporter [Propionibacterium sp.]